MPDYNADEIDRLVREGRDAVAKRGECAGPLTTFDKERGTSTVGIICRDNWDDVIRWLACCERVFPQALAALSAAKAEVERLTAGCTACRLENEANAEENDRLAAELQALKEEHTDLCEQRQKWLPKALDADRLAAEVERLTKERDKARSRVLRPLTEDEVVAALHEGRAERRVAEGDNAWTSLVNQRDRLAARVRELELTEEAKDALRWLRSLVEDGDCGLAGKLAVAVATLDRLTMPGAK